MKLKGAISAGLAVAGLASFAFAANATGLDGTTVGLTSYFPDMATIYSDAGTAVVGPGVEFGPAALTGYPLSFDLSDDQIMITSTLDSSFQDATFNGFGFTFSTVVPTGATIDGSSGFDPVAISFVGNELFLNFQGIPVSLDESSVIDLSFGSGVPEPASWALMLVGFGGIGGAMRVARRKQTQAIA